MSAGFTTDEQQFINELHAVLAEECPELGYLVAAINFKKSAVARFGVQRAFEVCRERQVAVSKVNQWVPGLDRLRCRRIASLKSVAEMAPAFKQLWAGGRPFVHKAPMVVGPGDHDDQHGVSRAAYLTCLQDVFLRGRSAVILKDDMVIVDFENDELTRFQDSPEFDPGVLHSDTNSYWTMEADPCPRVIEEAFMLNGSHTNDFGHWLTEYLPKLAIALMADIPDVPVLIDTRIPASHRQSLEIFCPNSEIIVLDHLAPCFVRKLWVTANPVYRGYYPSNSSEAWQGMLPDPENFARTIRKLKSVAGSFLAPPTGYDRVYLARKPRAKKLLVNHENIERIAAAQGFKILFPEELSFIDQLRWVHHARHIIAPDGSNGLLSYFVSAGAKVCFLNHTHTMPLVEMNGLLEALDASFTIVTGPMAGKPIEEPFWSDYQIDEHVFEKFLDSWLMEDPPVQADESPVQMEAPQVSTIKTEELDTISALDMARENNIEINRVSFGAITPSLEITYVDNVLYIPSAMERGQSLQIINGRYLPYEAVFDDFTAEFVKARLLKKDAQEFSGFAASDIPGDVCILGNVFSRNFTHWHEELMKVITIEQAGIDCTYIISELPEFARELLLVIGIVPERILEVHKRTHFKRALYGTPVSYRNVADYPEVLLKLRDAILTSSASIPDGIGTRLWLDRGQATRLGRKLVNEEEVGRLLERYEFQRLDMGALPVASQIAVARQTQVMAGLHGSHFVHSQLMSKGSFVIECFSPLYLNPTYTEIYRVLQHRYCQLSATNTPIFPYMHDRDVLVDCQQLDLALRAASQC